MNIIKWATSRLRQFSSNPATCKEGDIGYNTTTHLPVVATAANTWTNVDTGTGDVVGPASSTDNAIARFDGTTGLLLQNSTALIGDTGALTVVDTVAAAPGTLQFLNTGGGTGISGGTFEGQLKESGLNAFSIFTADNSPLVLGVNGVERLRFAATTGEATFSVPVSISGASFGLSGAISGAGIFGTSGIRYKNVASTLTDTTSSGTIATNYTNLFGANTLAASNATTITDAINTQISNPVQGSNVTLTNKWALGADSILVGKGITSTGVTDLLVNPTTKASGNLFQLATNSVNKFSVDFAGNGTYTGYVLASNFAFPSAPAYGLSFNGSFGPVLVANSIQVLGANGANQAAMNSTGVFGFLNGLIGTGTLDTTISRNAAGVVQIGTTAANASGSLLATNGTFSGTIIGTPQALSGAGAVNVTTLSTAFTSTGVGNALTLADGTNGQIKTIAHVADGGSGVLTPTTKSGFSTITFTNAGDAVTLQFFTTAGWIIIGQNGVTVTP